MFRANAASQPHAAGPSKPRPLATSLALALAMVPMLTPASALAAVLPVSNCNDDGTGSLRAVVASAASGDTVDLSGLSCSVITLTGGAIATARADLTIQGAGRLRPTISGGDASAVVNHLGTGTLTLRDLSVSHGAKYTTGTADARGGCVFSSGSVILQNVSAKYCTAKAQGTGNAKGGAVFATDAATILNSDMKYGKALANSGAASGGGVYSTGTLLTKYSNIRKSQVDSVTGTATGGAIFTHGVTTIGGSSITGNKAVNTAGVFIGAGAATSSTIKQSTIAGNEASSGLASGVAVASPLTVLSSTISGNTNTRPNTTGYGAGIVVSGTTVTLVSTIVSGNRTINSVTQERIPRDISLFSGGMLAGDHNLIGTVVGGSAPAGSILLDDPRLAPLGDWGGATATMEPMAGSPALNFGVDNGFATDQRGSGFARNYGGGVDIGAVENRDVIFIDGVDARF